jgi:hypothetical protein
LSVTRATTATRVNSAGLVELVPYNLLSNSQDFTSSSWDSNGTRTANAATAPDGTMTATRVQLASGSAQYLYQGVPFLSGAKTISCYIKGATAQTIGFNDGNAVPASINITTEWQRYTFTYNTNSGGMGIQFDNYFGVSPSQQAKDFYVWGAQLVEGSTAKDYQKTETRLNIPRLDYSNGTCPSLLVEPQRTNLALYSSSLDSASYTQAAYGTGTISVTANYGIAPDGTLTADRIQMTQGNFASEFFQRPATIIGQTYTLSFYAKALSGTPTLYTSFNLGGYENEVTFSNDWERYTYTYTATGVNTGFNLLTWVNYPSTSASADILVWGVQLEQGSYSTSYIPTTSASVTRNADVISKTGISSLIGQTEGTLFCDVLTSSIELGDYQTFVSVYGNDNNRVVIGKEQGTSNLFYYVNSNGSVTFQIITKPLGSYKIALAYKNGDSCLYINGVSVFTTSNAVNFSTTLTDFYINQRPTGFEIGTLNMNSAALWTTRLTNDQLATLTTL